MKVLGIETSCDETGVAIYDSDTNSILAEELFSQIDLHSKFGGVVPELASRDHILKLLPLIEKTVSSSGIDKTSIDGIAYTAGPGLRGSLLVGATMAQALSFGWSRPCIGIHHMEAHLLVNLLEENPPSFPFLTLLISGGHCLLIRANKLGSYDILGQTLDDAVGEAFDKVARLLELPYPGGPEIERLAILGKADSIKLPRPMTNNKELDFSFSGLKTAVLYSLKKQSKVSELYKANLAASFQEAVAETLLLKCKWALEKTSLNQLVIGGGVAANSYIRKRLEEGLRGKQVYFPPLERCTDNGTMIAYAGYCRFKMNLPNLNGIKVRPKWGLSDIQKMNMDTIKIEKLEIEVIIGIFSWEREVRQLISLDIEMEFDCKLAGKTDDINNALDYKKIAKKIIAFSENSKSKLIENLAENIAELVLKEFPIKSINIVLSKPGALRGSLSVGVSIKRENLWR